MHASGVRPLPLAPWPRWAAWSYYSSANIALPWHCSSLWQGRLLHYRFVEMQQSVTNHSTAQYPTAIQLSTLIKRGPEEIFLRPQNRRLQLILAHKMSIGPINGEELICCTPTDVIWVLRYLI